MSDRPGFEAGQVVTVFRSRLRDDCGADYGPMAGEMLGLAREMPGFVDFKAFVADDGERVSVITFIDAASQQAWRDQVDHRGAQRAGRERFYAEYSLQVSTCTNVSTFRAVTQTSYRQHRFVRPPGATEILLVRHGESEPSVPGRPATKVDGHSDPALAPEGEEQAERVGERLADQDIAAIYVTNLRRTQQTAAPLVARTGLTPVVEPDLREVFLGEWESSFRQRVAEGDPIAKQMFLEQRWDVIPGAEASEVFAAHVGGAIERIVAAHPDQRVAVFAHGGVIGELLHQAVGGGGAWAFVGVDNGSISHTVRLGQRWTIRRVNDTAHLGMRFD